MKCKIEECENILDKYSCKGYCTKHYNRLKRHGDPRKTTRIRSYFSIGDFIKNITQDEIDNHIIEDHTQWALACKIYYGDKCSICSWNKTTCDTNHIVPKSNGGLNTISNGEILCPNCHAEKHRKNPIEQRKYRT